MNIASKDYDLLTYAGMAPFIICSLLIIFGMPALPVLGSVKEILSSYTLIIISFLCGIQWGLYLSIKDKFSHNLFYMSNLLTIIAWAGFLYLSWSVFLILAALLFLVILAVDYTLKGRALIDLDYFQTRRNATIIVSACLLTSAIL